MQIALAQLDPIVGDITGNVARIQETLDGLTDPSLDLVVFPEMFLTGYPPKDLLEREWFIDQVQEAIAKVAAMTACRPELGILFGAPVRSPSRYGKPLYNAALLCTRGRVLATVQKRLLPTYDVFDEARYFEPARQVDVVWFKGRRLGIHICEDAWAEQELASVKGLYDCNPVRELVDKGAEILLNISASPYNVGKERIRFELITQQAKRYNVPFVYVNQIGGNDELVFDGRSLAIDGQGRPMAVLPSFQEAVQVVDTDGQALTTGYAPQQEIASVHDALILGIRDYMRKCGFRQALIGLSGGIDSAVTCALAAEALGPENVLGVSMPSRYSSQGSMTDAQELALNLGIDFKTIAIRPAVEAYLEMLADAFAGTEPNVAEENIQARIRGNILMALSNKFGYLVLSTGNKTELAVGYCTLYGDMSGGLAVISDVPKMMVYDLARYINRERLVIPQASIDKAPSAELKPDQVDQDTLPPYPLLDEMLRLYVQEGCSIDEIVAAGFARETVQWVVRTVNRNEYKRQQAAPGLRVTTKAFGVGRRMPIAAKF